MKMTFSLFSSPFDALESGQSVFIFYYMAGARLPAVTRPAPCATRHAPCLSDVRYQTSELHLNLKSGGSRTLLGPEKRDAHLRSFPIGKRRSGKLTHEFITKRAGKPKH